MNTIQDSKTMQENSPILNQSTPRPLKLNNTNYRHNLESDYTEKIEALEKSFDYASNSEHLWGDPELSILYGTPLYEQASDSQKLALNHLYWGAQYDYTAASEASTINYNQVTAGVFAKVGGYDSLCSTLEHESDQEKYHIHAFQNIGSKTKIALLGKQALKLKPNKNAAGKAGKSKKITSKVGEQILNLSSVSSYSELQYKSLRSLSKTLIKNSSEYYSSHLLELEEKGIFLNASNKGYFGVANPQFLLQFFAFHWGSSPFLACQHYTYRLTGNMSLKSHEHKYSRYFRELERKEAFIPVPTAVSHYHLLDEAFHTTTSQLIGRDLYKEFSKPTAYEQFIGNLVFYRMQRGFLGNLSMGMVSIFREDASFLSYYDKILRSPLFGMSEEESLYWLEKCLCQEHDGFDVQVKYHQKMLKNMLRLTDNLDYLWPVNREMQIMKAGGSIDREIANNVKAFRQFKETVNA
jgi:hypothetical protein